jgi:hypothetical protein
MTLWEWRTQALKELRLVENAVPMEEEKSRIGSADVRLVSATPRPSCRRMHQGYADRGQISHHCVGGVACSERDLRQTHKRRSENHCKGVWQHGPTRSDATVPGPG